MPLGVRLCPIRFSRARVPGADRVRRPRQVIAFRVEPDLVTIILVLDERMHLPARLTEP